MGYRANVVTQQREYGSQTFSDWTMFTSEFVPAMEDLGFQITGNDAEDFFEIEKNELQQFVDTLARDDKESIYSDYTNSELKEELQRAISETKELYISWEWF